MAAGEDEYMARAGDDLQYVDGEVYDGEDAYLDQDGNPIMNQQEYDYNNSPGAADHGPQCLANMKPLDDLSPEERNPKRYAGMPSCWTRRIAPAGKLTLKSEGVGVILGSGVH